MAVVFMFPSSPESESEELPLPELPEEEEPLPDSEVPDLNIVLLTVHNASYSHIQKTIRNNSHRWALFTQNLTS